MITANHRVIILCIHTLKIATARIIPITRRMRNDVLIHVMIASQFLVYANSAMAVGTSVDSIFEEVSTEWNQATSEYASVTY